MSLEDLRLRYWHRRGRGARALGPVHQSLREGQPQAETGSADECEADSKRPLGLGEEDRASVGIGLLG